MFQGVSGFWVSHFRFLVSGAQDQGGLCRANLQHMTQSRPYYGLGFQVKVLKSFKIAASKIINSSKVAAYWLGSGPEAVPRRARVEGS